MIAVVRRPPRQGGAGDRRRVRARRSSASATCSSSSSRCRSGRSCSSQLRLPEGTAINVTDEVRRRRPRRCSKDDEDIATYTTYVGQGSPRFWLGLNPQLPNEAFAEIVIVTKDVEARERIKARLEKAVAEGALTEARVRVDRFNFGPPVGFPVQFRVIGPDPTTVRDIAYEVRDVMAAEPERRRSASRLERAVRRI